MRNTFGWLTRNLGSLLLSFFLAVVVWVSAVITADPNQQQISRPVEIQIIGQDANLLLRNEIPRQVRLTLQAPQSIWDLLTNNTGLIKAWVDLSGLGAGEHNVPIRTRVDASPVRVIQVEPAQLAIDLEPSMRRTLPVELALRGTLPLGYQQGEPSVEPFEVTLSGPESLVRQVEKAQASLSISGATASVEENVPVEIFDSNGLQVEGITITPLEVSVLAPVNLLGGFKNVAVKVLSTGQVANGYRLTNITVSPPTVTIFSDNPNLIEQIPGFVETLPVDITNLTDDMDIAVNLNLPAGVSLVREPNVLVQVNVAAIEGTMTVAVPVEAVGLEEGLGGVVSPQVVDVIVTGPINRLETLTASDFQVRIDLTGLPRGIYQRPVIVDRMPQGMHVQTTLPESVEVIIDTAPTATPSPIVTSSATPTPTATPTLTPTLTPTRRVTVRPTHTPPP